MKLNKRGIIVDPRWVILFIILILFLLYLREVGVL